MRLFDAVVDEPDLEALAGGARFGPQSAVAPIMDGPGPAVVSDATARVSRSA